MDTKALEGIKTVHYPLITAIWTIWTPVLAILLLFALARSSVQPLASRGFALSVASSVSAWATVSNLLLDNHLRDIGFPCVLVLLVLYLFVPLYAFSYIARAVWVYNTFNHAKNSARLAVSAVRVGGDSAQVSAVDVLATRPSRSPWRIARVAKALRLFFFFYGPGVLLDAGDQFLLIALPLSMTISYGVFRFIISPTNRTVVSSNTCQADACMCITSSGYRGSSFVTSVLLLLLLFCMVRTWSVRDTLNIRNELLLVSLGWILLWVPGLVLGALHGFLAVPRLSALFAGSLVWSGVVSLFLPLYQSYSAVPVSRLPPGILTSFKRAIKLPDIYAVFLSFCVGEFSSENLLFWRAVQTYRQQPDEAVRTEVADNLWAQFVSPSAVEQVNLPASQRNAIRQAIAEKSFPIDLFDAASHHIERLMATDTYPRFLSSPKGQALVVSLLENDAFSTTLAHTQAASVVQLDASRLTVLAGHSTAAA